MFNQPVRWATWAPLVAVLCLLLGCDRSGLVRLKNANLVMGTGAEVTVYAPNRDLAQQAVTAAFVRLNDVNRLMSDYREDSEVSRINRLAVGEGLVVSPETFACFEHALEVCERSGGAFDITVRPLVRLWKHAGESGQLPAAAAVAGALEHVGWQHVILDRESRTVSVERAGVQVDLGGVAKGYALDLAGAALRRAGAVSGLVNVGGDVLALGRRGDGQPWQVAVRDPFAGRGSHFCVLALVDRAVATSGNQERFTMIAGRRYSHIVDPRTGWPAEQAPSVTVIAPDGLTADAWATVFSVLDVDAGEALWEREAPPGVEVLWILPPADDPVVRQTPGFTAFAVDSGA